MKLFKTLAIALGVTALSLSAIGCGDACEQFKSHGEDCDLPTSGTDSDAEVECTDQMAAVAECMVDLSCDELKNTDFAPELACAAATP